MNSNIVITLDTRRAKKDGTYPIILRLSHNGKTLPISTGYSVPEDYWDETNRKIKNTYKGIDNITRVNNFLQKERARCIDVLTVLNDKKELSYLSINELKEQMVIGKSETFFYEYTERLIKEQIAQKRIGNARSYANTLREIKNLMNERILTFNEINHHFLQKWEHSYLSRGLSLNGLAVHLRTIRAIFNKAIKERIIEREAYPFENYSIKTKPTKKRAISPDAIQRIVGLEYETNNPLFETRNIFLLSFYLMGAPYFDLANLKVKNIIDGRIQYKRQKTGKFYDIKITENLKPILDYYTKDKLPEEYILPIIKRQRLTEQYKDVLWARERYNVRLKALAKDAGIDENLTSYVSRHSFASIANNMAIPLTAISEMLGHQRLTTTQVYLAGLQKDVIDNYNEQIISGK
jgi:integrase/recombinase XerD